MSSFELIIIVVFTVLASFGLLMFLDWWVEKQANRLIENITKQVKGNINE